MEKGACERYHLTDYLRLVPARKLFKFFFSLPDALGFNENSTSSEEKKKNNQNKKIMLF